MNLICSHARECSEKDCDHKVAHNNINKYQSIIDTYCMRVECQIYKQSSDKVYCIEVVQL